MTIHSSHPFLPAESDRDPVRRLRGRLVAPVTLWTAGTDGRPAGLTVGSVTVADGAPAHVLGLLDAEAELYETATATGRFAVTVLRWPDRNLADVFAGLAPAPGGAFGTGTWEQTDWGPVPAGRTWAGCRLVDDRELGYGRLVTGAIERVELGPAAPPESVDGPDAAAALARIRGRYTPVVST